MDHKKADFRGKAMEALEELGRTAHIRTDGGQALRVYPVGKVFLGQEVILVADGRVSAWRLSGRGLG